ncbi:hypothetical protein MYMA111404_03050 [Mycoplasma marinum]|uniref:Uncharacterized protein n=1 Tax=Mycoplasma marinum TaxID=1937190 RepID=A0A4R0XNU2_9MOLU|nr:hypothetical protein [Mycoplasma marinum]TCG11172.1 hypothetical protein C4B24_02720 [Mycoplasma marinum]
MKHYKFKDKLWALKQLDTGRNKRSVALEFYYNHLERYRDKGNKTRKRKGRPKEISINDLNPNDREVYQKIINGILKDHNISRHEITERIKKEKREYRKY